MEIDNVSLACILLLLASIGMLIYAIVKNKTGSKEGYNKCICTEGGDGRGRTCQDDDVAIAAYDAGKATEYSDFPDKGWLTSSPGDMSFPEAKGCHLGSCGPNRLGL